MELAIDPVERTRGEFVRHRRSDRLAANDALQTHAFHQPFDRAARNRYAFTVHLQPDFPCAIDLEVFRMDTLDFRLEVRVAHEPRRRPFGVPNLKG